MTVNIFISLYAFGSAVSSLLTQALKKGWPNLASNLIALIVSVVVGGLGTSAVYIITNTAWNAKNIVCIFLMIFLIWMGSMISYDKVIQLLKQLKNK